MIKGVGIDSVEIKRMEASLKRSGFQERVFTKAEIANEHGDINEYYATRFAAKEAVFKATGYPKDWLTIEVLNREDGSPYVSNVDNVHISITTEAGIATAICIAEKD